MCIAYGLHRVVEQVRSHFSIVDTLIASVKQVSEKVTSRAKLPKREFSSVNFPSEINFYTLRYENKCSYKLLVIKNYLSCY